MEESEKEFLLDPDPKAPSDFDKMCRAYRKISDKSKGNELILRTLRKIRGLLYRAGNERETSKIYLLEMNEKRRYYRNVNRYDKLFINKFLQVFFNFGESLWLTFLWILLFFFVLFPAIYFHFDLIRPTNIEKSNINWWEAVYFSIVTVTTVGYGDYYPVGLGRLVVGIEISIGLVMVATLIWMITERANRKL